MKIIEGGITAPAGFKANGLYCGIKKSKRKDLALIYSERPCDAAGVFTTNQVQASCVVVNKEHLKDHRAQAIIANSGNANCMTGKAGFENSRTMTSTIAKYLRLAKKDVLVASTGVIGKPLPMAKILRAMPELVRGMSKEGSQAAAHAILTTDRQAKEISVEIRVGDRKVHIGAIAKGAGMIHPEMALAGPKHATMLCFVTTDAVISPSALEKALERAVDRTFNLITIDGDMSTNDMVIVLANGAAQNEKIVEKTDEFREFSKALEYMFGTLSRAMIRDAEGATKFVEVVVKNAQSREDAKAAAKSIAGSNLVKCAVFGSDPNWGRIAAAVGYSEAHVDPWRMTIYLGKEMVVKNGARLKKNAALLNRVFAQKNIRITVDLGLGKYHATAYTCDLSTGYVRINSAYRT